MLSTTRSHRSCPDARAAFRAAGRAAGCGVVWLLAAVLLAGCGPSPPAGAPAASVAKLAVANLCDREWEIVLTPAAGPVRRWRVKARAAHEASVPAGEYRGEQLLLTAGGEIEARRTLEVRFEAGKAYRWRLATLRSEPSHVDAAEPETGTAKP